MFLVPDRKRVTQSPALLLSRVHRLIGFNIYWYDRVENPIAVDVIVEFDIDKRVVDLYSNNIKPTDR